MYDDAMDAIHKHLIKKSVNTKMIYTAELIPERNPNEQMYVLPNISRPSYQLHLDQLMAFNA